MRWLHLSDFHFQALERWDRRSTLNALLRHARDLRDDGQAPDFVFVTGDVAFSGKKAEYEQAERFFVELAKTLDLDPKEHFFVVPGNHDVDRGGSQGEGARARRPSMRLLRLLGAIGTGTRGRSATQPVGREAFCAPPAGYQFQLHPRLLVPLRNPDLSGILPTEGTPP